MLWSRSRTLRNIISCMAAAGTKRKNHRSSLQPPPPFVATAAFVFFGMASAIGGVVVVVSGYSTQSHVRGVERAIVKDDNGPVDIDNTRPLLLATSASSLNRDRRPSSSDVVGFSSTRQATAAAREAQYAAAAAPKSISTSRTYATNADRYFRRHQKIPPPRIVHDNLKRMLLEEGDDEWRDGDGGFDETEDHHDDDNRSKRILVIGDVHGCLHELKELVKKATCECNDRKRPRFAAIMLVGDLCNKGPSSAETIAYVRTRPNWFSVRGNHDDRALAAALGDEGCRSKSKYDWVDKLSDEDVEWMSELPYTITIPKTMMYNDDDSVGRDVIVVHAGFDPSVMELNDQETNTMVNVRNLASEDGTSTAWAKLWRGPELVLFGHDAKRGMQRERYAMGLDTGCVYGKRLTGVIMPEGELVSVDATREHCPIEKKTKIS